MKTKPILILLYALLTACSTTQQQQGKAAADVLADMTITAVATHYGASPQDAKVLIDSKNYIIQAGQNVATGKPVSAGIPPFVESAIATNLPASDQATALQQAAKLVQARTPVAP